MLDEKDLQAIAQLFEPINDRLDKIETRVAKTDVFVENAVNPQIQLIAEGQRSDFYAKVLYMVSTVKQ